MPHVGTGPIERFRTLVAGRFGLHYPDDKLHYLGEVLRERSESLGSATVESYVTQLESAPKQDELQILADQLTVNETFFFRNSDNFRALVDVLRTRARPGTSERPLRILSAGCASGEEPYTIAILVRETLPELSRPEVEILGVDLSTSMLKRATEARYSAWSLRATPETTRRRYFVPQGRDFVLIPEVRQMVTFEEGNLVDDRSRFWRLESYDLVFCRNVIMYFTPDGMRGVITRVGRSLKPGGFLFLGHAETLRGLSQDFHLCHTHDTFYYQKRIEAPLAEAAPGRALPQEFTDALPAVIDSSTSWVDAIQHASERIAELAAPRPPKGASAGVAPAAKTTSRAWDLRQVSEAMRQERFAEALGLLDRLPSESSRDPESLLLQAVLLTNLGKLAEAEKVCLKLLALDEFNAGAHYAMALCREHALDRDSAVEHDQTAIYLDPSFAMPHLHLGLMARRTDDPTTALRELSRACELLAKEDPSRLLLFGGGFSRDTLLALCRAELIASGGAR